jgi:hypothetical protein
LSKKLSLNTVLIVSRCLSILLIIHSFEIEAKKKQPYKMLIK